MEIWIIIVVTISISLLYGALFGLCSPKKTYQTLPPGPLHIPIVSDILWLKTSLYDVEPYLRKLHKKLGPIVTLNFLSLPTIFISDRSIAHQALIQKGALFADRPQRSIISKILGYHINSDSYGPKWRLLRRNLSAEILHPSRVKAYSHARKWVLQVLLDSLTPHSKSGQPVRVVDNFQYAMFCLLVLMCFGDKLDQEQIREIEKVQRRMMVGLGERFNLLNLWPKFTRLLLRERWKEFHQIVDDQEKVVIRLIRARRSEKEERLRNSEGEKENEHVLAYVDTLLDIQLPEEENRNLTEQEIASLCSEFLNAGTDTTFTALQWIMANLVKYPHIQEKLFMEIKGVIADGEKEVKEEDTQKIPYLKAVILEGLRRHPPAHFVFPHTVREDTVLGGFLLPKNVTINFQVADIGWDPKVWEDPMAFKPERFQTGDNGEEFDMTGSREIKMMPFGVGRRICPGLNVAMLHLEYFVANLIWNFEWKAVDGDEVSLEEQLEFTVMMKTPLQAHIYPRKS